MNSHTDSHVDIALVGSGLVGTPLALMLARRGWRVAVLDKLAPAEQIDVRHCQLDQRCTALSASSRDFLSDESLWSAVASDACAIRRIHVSQQGYFGATRLTAHEEGVEALGYVVDNHRFVASLQPQMQSSPFYAWLRCRFCQRVPVLMVCSFSTASRVNPPPCLPNL